ncbi:hypothetical protein PG991_014639 [Apiospora marii]|uniref:Uncharacterized protein n=1 Tax=Apiospora marii TaxID=335849 RepID=A0ABR1R470_9PEZI
MEAIPVTPLRPIVLRQSQNWVNIYSSQRIPTLYIFYMTSENRETSSKIPFIIQHQEGGTSNWGHDYITSRAEQWPSRDDFEVSEKFRNAFQKIWSSCFRDTYVAEYCLAHGIFAKGVTGLVDAGPNIPALLFRLKDKLSPEALMEFKDKYKEQLQKEFAGDPTAVFPTKLLVAVAQPVATDKPETHRDLRKRKEGGTLIDVDGVHVYAAAEVLEFADRAEQAAPVQERPTSIHPRGTRGGRAPPMERPSS